MVNKTADLVAMFLLPQRKLISWFSPCINIISYLLVPRINQCRAAFRISCKDAKNEWMTPKGKVRWKDTFSGHHKAWIMITTLSAGSKMLIVTWAVVLDIKNFSELWDCVFGRKSLRHHPLILENEIRINPGPDRFEVSDYTLAMYSTVHGLEFEDRCQLCSLLS